MNSVIVISLVIVFLLFIALVASRSQALQRFAVMELILLCVIAGGAAWGYGKASAFSETQYLRLFGVYLQQASSYMGYLEELELDEDAQEVEKQNLEEMLSSILPVATVGDTSYTYLNAAILERDVDTYQAVLHVGEDEAFPEEWLEEAAVLAGNAISQQSASYGAYTGMDGERIGLLALADPQKIAPDKVLLVEISLAPMEQEMRSLAGDYVYAGSAIGLIGSIRDAHNARKDNGASGQQGRNEERNNKVNACRAAVKQMAVLPPLDLGALRATRQAKLPLPADQRDAAEQYAAVFSIVDAADVNMVDFLYAIHEGGFGSETASGQQKSVDDSLKDMYAKLSFT